MKARYLIISILLLAACQQIEEPFDPRDNSSANKDRVYTLTIQATKSDAVTKALALDGNTLKSYWTTNDKVRVFRNNEYVTELDVVPGDGEYPLTATLTATDVSDLQQGDQLFLLIPRKYTSNSSDWIYTGQNGLLTGDNSVSTKYDYATATVTVSTIDGTNITTTTANFDNEQSIYRFGFKVGDNKIDPSDITISSANGTLISSRTLSSGGWADVPGSLTFNPTATSDHLYYFALRNTSSSADTYNFVIHDANSALYMASISNIDATLLKGKFNSAKSIPTSQTRFAPGDATGTVGDQSGVL
ncbi:MAG: hypothetical protein J5639_03510 [Bacteroidales bacterium]|nr:hypothetical protein [Bacteroidales bacterium]